MNKEKPSPSEIPEVPAPALSGKRRVAKTRAGIPGRSAKRLEPTEDVPAKEKPLSTYPVFDESEAPAQPVPSEGEGVSQEVARRKRRRKKGKGGGSQGVVQAAVENPLPHVEDESVPQPPRPAQQKRSKPDSESVAKLAWKIYLAEVSEEGVALIGDSDAKELTRRCFRLAEIFMEEQSRRG